MKIIKFKGQTVIVPLYDLKYSLDVYLPSMDWFEWDEQKRKDWVRDRDKCKCQISGRCSRVVHEITPKGMGGCKSALVPWNQLVLDSKVHHFVHRGLIRIKKFDPLDLTDGLKIETDINIRPYFYQKAITFDWKEKYLDGKE